MATTTPTWLPGDIDGVDDPQQMLSYVNRAILLISVAGQQNQNRGNLLMRAQLRELRTLRKELMAQIASVAPGGLAANMARIARNPYGGTPGQGDY